MWLWAGTLHGGTDTTTAVSDDVRLEASRELAERFAGQLKAALQAALADGPVAAIAVCRDQAPAISSALSRESGARVGRISSRYRNPNNAPEPWQTAVLERFDGAAADEHFDAGPDGVRYLQAIRMQPLCLTCHGTDLAPGISARLEQDYPHDRARGYQVGELRGAFVITWPAG